MLPKNDKMISEKFVPSTVKSPVAPKSVKELEYVMTEMDRINGTSFKQWVLSEENIGYICTFKREIFENNWETNPSGVFTVLQWLSEGWKTPSVAEFLLKMFYRKSQI